MAKGEPGRQKRLGRAWAFGVGLLLATLWVYAPVRRHEFVAVDDLLYVVENPDLRQTLDLGTAWTVITGFQQVNWSPLTTLSLMVDYRRGGLRASTFLSTNVALHALATLLLFAAVSRLTGRVGASAFVAAVFALHPLHVESVAWVSTRKDVLSGLFFAAALLAWPRGGVLPLRRLRSVALATLCLGLGLMSKPTLVTAPFVLLLVDYWPAGGWSSWRQAGARLLEKVPMFLLAGAVAFLTYRAQEVGGAMEVGRSIPWTDRWANAAVSVWTYVGKAFAPRGLAVFYPFPDEPPGPLVWGTAWLCLAIATWSAWRVRRSWPWVPVGWLWFVGMLVPTLGFVQVGGQARADRYTYLPLIGLSLVVAWTVVELQDGRRWLRHAVEIGAVGIVVVLAVAARAQVHHWRNSRTLFERDLAVTTDNAMAHEGLGWILLDDDNLAGARSHFEAAARLRPEWSQPRVGLAQVTIASGETAAGLELLRRERRRQPGDAGVAGRLGLALFEAGQLGGAGELIEQALGAFPGSPELLAARAGIAEAEGRVAAAAAAYRRGLEVSPGSLALRNNLAWLLGTTTEPGVRDPAAALGLATSLLAEARSQADGVRAQLLDTLAAAQAATGDFERAVATIDEAVRLADAAGLAGRAEAFRARAALYRARRVFSIPPASPAPERLPPGRG